MARHVKRKRTLSLTKQTQTLFSLEDDNNSSHLIFLLKPIVFILIKIGEFTVRSTLLIYRLVVSFIRVLFRLMRRVGKKSRNVLSLITQTRHPIFAFVQSAHYRFRSLTWHKKTQPLVIQEEHKTHLTTSDYPQQTENKYENVGLVIKIRYFLSGISVALLVLTPLLIRLWLSELPNPNQLALKDTAISTKLYDRNGKYLFQFYGNENRTKISLSNIPNNLINATIAIEDKNFYRHSGFDIEAIIRAAHETFVKKNLQGGSTLTQQLIKSALLTPDVTLERKVKEVILAFLTERVYTKKQILEMYFNQVPYGGTAWGIETAAQTYFGKSAKDLTLAECALLAGLPSAPTLYSPFGARPELARQRQGEVLKRMVEEGFINQKQADAAYNVELTFAKPDINIRAPHFIMYVKDYLTQRYGIRAVEQGGLQVTTTLDTDLQNNTQTIVKEETAKLTSLSVSNGAAIITNPQTGQILAMVGSRDYFDTDHDGNVNVTTANRQPGSSIKVVTYAAALEKGLTAASILDDSPITYNIEGSPPYSPVNYDGRFHGKVSLRESFGNSYNVPAVKTLAQIGVPSMIEMGRRLGITTWNDEGRFGLSLTLGGGEVKMTDLAVAYGTVAAGGIRNDLTPILKVTDTQGNILEDHTQDAPNTSRRELSEAIAFILSDILADNNARSSAFGPNSVLNIPGHHVSVKTGTSDNKRDNWTIGFTSNRLVAVWVGNNDNSPMNPALTSGITGAAPIWNKLITQVLSQQTNIANENYSPPSEIVALPVCKINGLMPCGGCPTKTEYFVEGTQPKIACRPDFTNPATAIGGAEPTRTQ